MSPLTALTVRAIICLVLTPNFYFQYFKQFTALVAKNQANMDPPVLNTV